MATNKKRVIDATDGIDIMHRCCVHTEWERGRTGFAVVGEMYDEDGKAILYEWKGFNCDKDGYISRAVYNQAKSYALGLDDAVDGIMRYFRRNGKEVFNRWDIEARKTQKEKDQDSAA